MLGKRISYEVTGQEVRLVYEHGVACITVWKADLIRVFSPLEDRKIHSKAVAGVGPEVTQFSVMGGEEALVIRTSKLLVRVYDEFYVDFYRVIRGADGAETIVPLCREYRGERKIRVTMDPAFLELLASEGHDVSHVLDHNYPVQTVRIMDGDEKFYGLGDKTGFLNKRYYEFENWNTDNPHAHTEAYKALYKSVPDYVKGSGRVWNLF